MKQVIGGPLDGAAVDWDEDDVAALIPNSTNVAHYHKDWDTYQFVAVYAQDELRKVEE